MAGILDARVSSKAPTARGIVMTASSRKFKEYANSTFLQSGIESSPTVFALNCRKKFLFIFNFSWLFAPSCSFIVRFHEFAGKLAAREVGGLR